MRFFMAGAAAIALAASGAAAQGQGNGKGNGNSGGNKPAAAQNKGNGGTNKADRGPQRRVQSERRGGQGQGNRTSDRGPDRSVRADRSNNRNPGANVRVGNGPSRGDADVRIRYDDRVVRDTRWLTQDRTRSFIDGCPPGLAKKRNGCNPPGQVKDREQRSLFGTNYLPGLFGLRNYDRRGDYYYRDGYLVRYGDSGISSWIPLLGGALGIGNIWPNSYESYRVPDYYVDYYDLGGPNRYRYADNVIYRVSPEDAAITSIAALITGDDFTVGSPMPRGYDVYNVPYGYRDRYVDTPNTMYRYSDGYIYEIDPETRLVAAAIDLLI